MLRLTAAAVSWRLQRCVTVLCLPECGTAAAVSAASWTTRRSHSQPSLSLFRRGVPACLSATLTRLGDSSRRALGRGVPLSQRRSEPAEFSRPQPVTLRHSSGNQSPLFLSTAQFSVCHELTSNSIISSTSTHFFGLFARCWDLGSSTYPPTVIDYPVSPWFAVLATPLNHCRTVRTPSRVAAYNTAGPPLSGHVETCNS